MPGLVLAARREFLTPLGEFGASEPVDEVVFRIADAGYALAAPHLGPGLPVRAVGWARNDYWAVRVWSTRGHGYRNDYDPDEPGRPAPPLVALGWPDPLAYVATLTTAKERAGTRVMVSAGYRLTDGSFTSHTITTGDRTTFHFAAPNPGPDDVAVAVEFGLVGPRWERHLDEVRAINEQNRRDGSG